MSTASKIAWDDTVLPFQLDRSDIRGRVVRLDKTIDTIIGQHNYPAAVQALVAEAGLLTALIGQTIDLQWKLSIQIRGEGAIRLIATDYYAPKIKGEAASVRAYASYDEDALQDDVAPFDQLGSGLFGITIDQGADMRPYQGITPLAGGSLTNCASTYFAQSEQLPTRFILGAALSQEPGLQPSWRAGGIMVQHLAKPGEAATGKAPTMDGLMTHLNVLDGSEAEDWNRTVMHLETTELVELIGPHVGSDSLLYRLFHEEEPRVYESQPIKFGCTCSQEKVEETVANYRMHEIEELQLSDGTVTADCQFCGAHYRVRPKI